ncbi:NeuD/PglB/VioB family sugar acetyltransferase [Chloroflexota bacterium]
MNEIKSIFIPLLNPNEPEALITEISVENGQHIHPGDRICTLETTKSTSEVVAEQEGFITGLKYKQGQFAPAGDVLCYIAETSTSSTTDDGSIKKQENMVGDNTSQDQIFNLKDLRITHPAKELAIQSGLDLRIFPKDQLITRDTVLQIIKNRSEENGLGERKVIIPNYIHSETGGKPAPLVIYGGGGHGKAVIDLLNSFGQYRVVGIIDDAIKSGERILGVPSLGGENILEIIHDQGIDKAINAVGGIGNMSVRVKVFERLIKANFRCPTIVHPRANIETSASLSEGIQIFPHAYVGSDAKIGYGCIVNTGAIISHECELGDYANISPGAILAGDVHIGNRVLVGMGVTINLGVRIGAGARIGNGAIINSNVPEKSIVKSGEIWSKNNF